MNYFNILIIIAAVAILWLVLTYNGLIRRRYRVKEAWADIDVQLKRRYDLIPNLIETVKGYAAHEKEAFEKVTQARAQALGAQGIHNKEVAENTLSSALKSIFAIAEAYPQLRAVESFTKLQEELADTENKIQAARRFYNGNAMELNTKIETFPTNLIAGTFGFKKEEFFQLEQQEAKEPVKVKF
ncbi:MAG: LemA family protein [Patescibacteria group bacterium]|nr:LemA family protein [Patescibacteria group bacterium]